MMLTSLRSLVSARLCVGLALWIGACDGGSDAKAPADAVPATPVPSPADDAVEPKAEDAAAVAVNDASDGPSEASGKPSDAPGEPSDAPDEPSDAADKPSDAADKPSEASGKPTRPSGKATAVSSKGDPSESPSDDAKGDGAEAGAAPSDAKDKSATAAATPNGADLYAKKCKNCHGVDGQADTKLGKKHDIETWKEAGWKSRWTLAKIETIVREGKDDTKMKPFKDKLTAAEIKAVSTFARSLGS